MGEMTSTKIQDEGRQGEAFAPFEADPNQFIKKFYVESYGCAMNFADSEIVASILQNEGFGATSDYHEADLIFINTCSIREKAEQTVRSRLHIFRQAKKHRPSLMIGVLGRSEERRVGTE